MGFGNIFGSESKSSNQTTSTTTTQNQQTAVQGNVGTLVAPGATLEGITGRDVIDLMANLGADHQQERTVVANLASTMNAGLQAATRQVGDILAATKAPDSNTITQLLPLAIILIIAWAITR